MFVVSGRCWLFRCLLLLCVSIRQSGVLRNYSRSICLLFLTTVQINALRCLIDLRVCGCVFYGRLFHKYTYIVYRHSASELDANNLPGASLTELDDPNAQRSWIQTLLKYGIAVVRDVDPNAESTQKGWLINIGFFLKKKKKKL